MKRLVVILLLSGLAACPLGAAVVERSDVVFMYQADASTYADYGATVVAWGGKPTPASLEAAKGLRFFGSVGMVTEFSRYYERFPQAYRDGLCQDVNGQPVKVPWLTDHQHQGVPYWWCCTQQPLFRQYLRERVVETLKAGACGVHVDDHLGTAGGLWVGICFCDRCVKGFRMRLKSLPAAQIERLGVVRAQDYDFRAEVREWISNGKPGERSPSQHPLWSEWTVYQCRAAAAFMRELHDVANTTAGHRVPMGANAGLLWPRHLCDYQTLDLFSAETDHHAGARSVPDAPMLAYRLADAVGRPYAATASGGDWAFIKEHSLHGLVRSWIALSYAAGHCLMAPHRQWCYTDEKGTHWYQGPKEEFAPLYKFVRSNAQWFDGYENHADVAIVLPHRSFVKDPGRWIDLSSRLTAKNVSYRVLLGGDEIVEHGLDRSSLERADALLIPDRSELLPSDLDLVERCVRNKRVFASAEKALAAVQPAVQVRAEGPVRVLPRVKAGSAVIHVLNYDYDAACDDVRPIKGVKLTLDVERLGVRDRRTGRWVTPDAPEAQVTLEDGRVELPTLALWGMLIVPL